MHPAFHIDCPRCGTRIEPAPECPHCGNWLGEQAARRRFGPVRELTVKDAWRVEDSLEDELLSAIDAGQRAGLQGLVLIHGWGSSGVGGRLRRKVREELYRFERMNLIRAWIGGEDFTDLGQLGLAGARRDRDRLRAGMRHWAHNPGISLVRL